MKVHFFDKCRPSLRRRLQMILLTSFMVANVQAQTTGKISGTVADAGNKSPLAGANVQVSGTPLGAVSGLDGSFHILNVPPGTYRISARMLGYSAMHIDNLVVSVNRTSTANFQLHATLLEGEVVVVQADKISTKKDQTSSIRNVSAQQMQMLPVEDVEGVIGLQAGVVAGHFRGGRSSEVSYLVDGLQVNDSFAGERKSIDIETDAIQDLEVITGTFNAEYGRAMSGVVNAVTKEGSNQFHGSASASTANYFTSHHDIFIGLKHTELTRNQDYKVQLSGPLWRDRLIFFTNLRYQHQDGYLNGMRRFVPTDYNNFTPADTALWQSQHSGDESSVPMAWNQNLSFLGKLTAPIGTALKFSLVYSHNQDDGQNYQHYYKYNPDGMVQQHNRADLYLFQFNHMLSNRAFHEGKFSILKNETGSYLFKDPLDSRYVHDLYGENDGVVGFSTGGQNKNHSERLMRDVNVKWDLIWQLHNHHSLKGGVLYTQHEIDNRQSTIRNYYFGTNQERIAYRPVVFPDSSIYSDIYRVEPREWSAYLQDKIEYDEIVLNMGLRYDYFDPNTTYPSQRRNPANQLSFPDNPEKMSTAVKAKPRTQWSPRLGLSYKLGSMALMHFSYGHFFQMPPMYALYENHSSQVAPNDYATIMGNPQLDAQKTVQYEVGLWQQLSDNMGLELALFYRDIYSLLSTRIVSTFNQIEYGLYSNKDYGNVKGLEIKYNFARLPFSMDVNYTLQYTRGNADNPLFTFDRAGDAKDPVPALIPMSWDQRHTANITLNYTTARSGFTVTGYYDSGTPYTWQPLAENLLSRINLYPNNAGMPGKMSVDWTGYYLLQLRGSVNLKCTLSIYNLLDRLNENMVNSRTGRAYTSIITDVERNSHRSDFNVYEDRIQNPAMYAAPRMIKLGLGIVF